MMLVATRLVILAVTGGGGSLLEKLHYIDKNDRIVTYEKLKRTKQSASHIIYSPVQGEAGRCVVGESKGGQRWQQAAGVASFVDSPSPGARVWLL